MTDESFPRTRSAFRRLEAVIDRLDSAIVGRGELVGQIDVLRAENAELRDVTRAVSSRLDEAIGRVQMALEG
ncbi:MAG: hypothetical protein HQL40_15905 [Alphaproteobacteria bacterium]|nr:hypothetical protein [Alphaproteobacteria bacterium]